MISGQKTLFFFKNSKKENRFSKVNKKKHSNLIKTDNKNRKII